MIWGKLIMSGNNTQLFSVNIPTTLQRLNPKLTQNIQQGHLCRISHFCWRKHSGLKMHPLSELLAIRVCCRRILQGCWLSDWCLYCVYGTLLWGLPSSSAVLLFDEAMWLQGRPLWHLPGAAGDSSSTSVEVPGFSLSLQKGLSLLLHQWELQWQHHLQMLWWSTKQIHLHRGTDIAYVWRMYV